MRLPSYVSRLHVQRGASGAGQSSSSSSTSSERARSHRPGVTSGWPANKSCGESRIMVCGEVLTLATHPGLRSRSWSTRIRRSRPACPKLSSEIGKRRSRPRCFHDLRRRRLAFALTDDKWRDSDEEAHLCAADSGATAAAITTDSAIKLQRMDGLLRLFASHG